MRRSSAKVLLVFALVPLVMGPWAEIASPPRQTEFRSVLEKTHWIAYAPTHYFPAESPPVFPSDVELLADLSVLRNAGFDGLVTYGSDVKRIPALAQQVGFRHLLLGIWDPWNPRERANVLRSIRDHNELISGVIIGNEGLSAGRYRLEALCGAMTEIGKITHKPVSTTEPFDWVLSEPKLSNCSTFLTVNAHPYFSNRKSPEDAVRWTLEAWNALNAHYPNKPLLFKETGLPSAGDGALSEENQKKYYVRLAQTHVLFVYFEAFDATPRFKKGKIEQSWGLWKADRTPKAVVESLPWRARGQQLH